MYSDIRGTALEVKLIPLKDEAKFEIRMNLSKESMQMRATPAQGAGMNRNRLSGNVTP